MYSSQQRFPWKLMLASSAAIAASVSVAYLIYNNSRNKGVAELLASAEKLKLAGNIYFRDIKFDKALTAYEQAIERLNGHNGNDGGDVVDDDIVVVVNEMKATLHSNMAATLEQMGRNEEALDHGLQAVQFNPLYAKAYLRCACSQLSLKMGMDALKNLAIALTLNPEWIKSRSNEVDVLITAIANERVKELMAKRGNDGGPSVNEYHMRSIIHDVIPDDIFCKEWVEHDIASLLSPSDFTQMNKMLELLNEPSKQADCVKFCDQLLSTITKDDEKNFIFQRIILLVRATSEIFMNVFRTAAQDLEQLLSDEFPNGGNYDNVDFARNVIDKLKVGALIRLTYICTNTLMLEEAYQYLNRALKINPNRALSVNYVGQMCTFRREFAFAVDFFEKTLRLLDNNNEESAKLLFKKTQLQRLMAQVNHLVVSIGAPPIAPLQEVSSLVAQMKSIIVGDSGSISKSNLDIEIKTEYIQMLYDLRLYSMEAYEMIKELIEANNTPDLIPVTYPQIAACLLGWVRDEEQGALQQYKTEIEQTAERLLHEARNANCNFDITFYLLAGIEYQRRNIDKAIEYLQEATKFSRAQEQLNHMFSFIVSLELTKYVQNVIAKHKKDYLSQPIVPFTTYLSSFANMFTTAGQYRSSK